MIHQALFLSAHDFIAALLIFCVVFCAVTLLVCLPLLIHKEKHGREGEARLEQKKDPDWDFPSRNWKGRP